ncbi:MAG: two-component system, OmpR family, operon response regulator KdpE [Frankiaceae bacterium]|jgi:two-component system KDP operon response regulator KdpE|nr:two-component system, OmpR family, operon response regulator KdpE [Frankiaceae bacterium]
MTRILVVDDEAQLVRALAINLHARGYEVHTAATGADALAEAARTPPDLVVLDLGLPDMDGLDVVAGLRGWTAVPIVVLSAREGQHDKVAVLDTGADDYVTKPFGMDELLARIRAALRRAAPSDVEGQANVALGDVVVDLSASTVTGPSGAIRLTPTEWHLLTALLQRPGKLVGQKQLLQEVWGPAYSTESHYLRVYMAQLRRKLEADPAHPRFLVTEPGLGYRFEP